MAAYRGHSTRKLQAVAHVGFVGRVFALRTHLTYGPGARTYSTKLRSHCSPIATSESAAYAGRAHAGEGKTATVGMRHQLHALLCQWSYP
jgi:hypothetical protein